MCDLKTQIEVNCKLTLKHYSLIAHIQIQNAP